MALPRTISSSFITLAGEKKCIPSTSAGRAGSTAGAARQADPDRKVMPALHLIAVVAQGYPGPARKYRLQMPDSVIERVAGWAEQKGWILFLDIQPGLSSVEAEIPHLVKYLSRPYVHLALDPEFAMKDGKKPGTDWMGRMDATEVNHAIGEEAAQNCAHRADEDGHPQRDVLLSR